MVSSRINTHVNQGVRKEVQRFAPKKYTPQKRGNITKKTRKNQHKRERKRAYEIENFNKKADRRVPTCITIFMNSATNGFKKVLDNIFGW